MKPIFSFLTGDVNWLDYGGKWISQKFNNSEFNYWLVLELINMDDACGRDNEGQPKYNVSLQVVSPEQAGAELDKAAESCGVDSEQLTKATDAMKVELLSSYGVYAQIFTKGGNNARKLIREAKKEATISNFLFGFAMDRPVNRIGTSGWDAIRGDLTAGLRAT